MNSSRTLSYRVIDVGHLQQVLGAAVLLHLDGLPPPLHGYAVAFGKVCVRGHLHVSALEDDLVDVILVLPVVKGGGDISLTSGSCCQTDCCAS